MCTSKKRVALILYTQGLDYDDRIRKEILSIMNLSADVEFKIFAIDPKNREENGTTSYGVPYYIPYLKTRDKYPSTTHTLSKALDFYKSIRKELKSFDVLWCADVETFPFVLLTGGKSIVWDHHELPEPFMRNAFMRMLYKFMERKCKVIIHANQPRLDYMSNNGLVSDINKHFVLRNFPDFNEIDSDYDETYYRFERWLGDGKCLYLQGLTGSERADVESIGAILSVPDIKAVVVGRISDTQMSLFDQLFDEQLFRDRVFFTGQQKQLKTSQYIRKCVASLIFYKKTNANNWYCEPNRLFQNLNNGNPVIVGNNPPMKEIVEQYQVGICVETDGGDQEKIVNAIQELLSQLDIFKVNLEINKEKWLWKNQEDILITIINKI